MTASIHLSADSTPRVAVQDRYRLYVHLCGDHLFHQTDDVARRYLCLLGCWFRQPDDAEFQADFDRLRGNFVSEEFDFKMLQMLEAARFRISAVVLDKLELARRFGESTFHPYQLGMGMLLYRYASFLNRSARRGDVLAQSRGPLEDELLMQGYAGVLESGVGLSNGEFFRRALTSREIELRPKDARVAGLQLAALLCHPVKHWILQDLGPGGLAPVPFAARMMDAIKPKFHTLYGDRVAGWGAVLYPGKPME